jgi:predicted CXXCH cytochrome family protein
VGFHQGDELKRFWRLEEHKLGEQTFTHFADGTAHKNRMQGNDFVQSVMYTRGITCFACHDVHGTSNNADLIRPANVLCLQCHGPKSPNGPHTATIAQHTHHRADSTGSECVGCHMPKIEQEIADVNVRSHTFRFISPSLSETSKVPNPCVACHTDKTNAWAMQEMKSWPEFSPWRLGASH